MKRIIGRVLFGLSAFLCVAAAAEAAGINSAEQSVLSAVSQPFSYNGKTYVVNSASIAEGRAKLSQEGVDLTEGDANECISQFYQSYAELVSEGYCDEIEDEDETEQMTPGPEVKHSKNQQKQNKEFIRQILGEPPEEVSSAPKDSEKNEAGEKNEKTEVQTSQASVSTDSQDEWSYEESPAELLEFDKQDEENASKKQLTLKQGKKEYKLYAREQIVVDKYTRQYLDIWKIFLIGLLVFTVATMIGMLCYIAIFKRRHKKKKGLRRLLPVMGGVCVTGWTLLLLVAFGLYFGVYNKGAIHRQLMESNYFSGITQMTQRQAAKQLKQAGCDEAIAEEIFTLSNVYIEEKQYIDAVLSGKGKAEISVDKLHTKLTERLDAEKDAVLLQTLEKNYKNTLHFEMGSRIKVSRDAFIFWFYVTVAAGIAALILLTVLMYFIYGHFDKAVQVGAIGMLPAAIAVTIVMFLAKYIMSKQEISVKPVYYQEFLQSYISWDIQVLLYVGCIGLLCSVALLVWTRHLHKVYAR